jgi:outer membrane assembly lipoprotein YfgL
MSARRCVAGGLAAAAAALLLVACSSTSKPKPTPLDTVAPQIDIRQVWQAKIGAIGYPLIVATPDGQFVAAGEDGGVAAFDAASGRALWRAQAGAPLSAGVGSDGRYAAVVTRASELVVFEAGTERWRKRLPAPVQTAPLVAGDRVFVLRVDRGVQAFDAADGRALWQFQRPGEALSLQQSGLIAPFGDTLLVGQGPRLTALDPLRGSVRWDVPIATPRGTNEVERLADLIGPPARIGDLVCARAFQSAVGCVDAARGVLVWSRSIGGSQAVGGDADVVVGADANSRLTAFRVATGEAAWGGDRLLYRDLSGVRVAGPVAIVGDLEGQVHFLSRTDGQALLRLPTDGSAVVGTPALSGSTVLVSTRSGGLFAFRAP